VTLQGASGEFSTLLDKRVLELLDLELAWQSLAEFVKYQWDVVEPGTELEWNWHLDVVCYALERQILGDPLYRLLLICIPPGTMKSLLVSVFAPAWQWLRQPERRKIFLANDDDLAKRDSRRTREIINSEKYQTLLSYCSQVHGQSLWALADDQNEKVNFENTRRGFRQCRSIGAKIIGKRGDDLVIDDPIDGKDVVNGSVDQVRKRLAEVANVVDVVLPSRVNDLRKACWTIIMQRLHPDDTAGRAMVEGGWKVINLQMEFEPGNPLNHPDDPRTEKGELLFPAKFPRDEVERLKRKLSRHYTAQYQQSPLPGEGGPLKRWYWCFWYPEGAAPPAPVRVLKPDGEIHECKQMSLPKNLQAHTQSWDMAFKDTKDSAYVVGQVWAQLLADSFLLDQVRAKMDFNVTCDAVRKLSKAWPQAIKKLVEEKANGAAVMASLRREIAGFEPVEPEGGKEARANAITPVLSSGNVWIPHPAFCSWVAAYIEECDAFPSGLYADQVDTTTQYLIRRYGKTNSYDYKTAPRPSSGFNVRRGVL
jgi:predicted phage terminase large subunit-like protein